MKSNNIPNRIYNDELIKTYLKKRDFKKLLIDSKY
jgi:hypothetical protein